MHTSEGQPPLSVQADGPGAVATEVVQSADGDAVLYYQCTRAGNYQLAVRLAGSDVLVGGTPLAFSVDPDAVAVASCQVKLISMLCAAHSLAMQYMSGVTACAACTVSLQVLRTLTTGTLQMF